MALVAVEVSGEVLVEAGVEGEEDLEVGEVEVEVETLISGQETGLARTQAVGTCALPGGRSATNATNPGVEVGSSTQQEAGEAMPGEVGGVAGSFFIRNQKPGNFAGNPNSGKLFSPKTPSWE